MAQGTRVAVVALLVAVALFAPSRADACSCVGGTPLCDTFWRTSAVFIGEVVGIAGFEEAAPSGTAGRYLRRRVTLRVDRLFRGQSAPQVEVVTGVGGGDCGYPFQRGEKYLVFANVWDGRLSVSICGPTRRLSDAAEELAYVSRSFAPAVGGRVFGRAQLRSGESLSPGANQTIRLRGHGREWTTATDATGAFEFRDIPAGKYNVEAVVPETLFGSEEVELRDPRGCARADLFIVPDGRITVPVKLASGAIPPQADIQLVFVESLHQHYHRAYEPFSYDSKTGLAVWSRLPPGRYALGINITTTPSRENPIAPVFYPGVKELAKAAVMTLGPGERVTLDPFQLPPPAPMLEVRGTVVRPDSRTVAGLNVRLESGEQYSEGQMIDSAETDKQGRFVLQGVTGSRVRVVAYWTALVSSEPFELTPATAPILIVLRPKK